MALSAVALAGAVVAPAVKPVGVVRTSPPSVPG